MQLFEKNTYSVVNIFDVTLRPQLNVTGAVEVFFFIVCKILFIIFLLTLLLMQSSYPPSISFKNILWLVY